MFVDLYLRKVSFWVTDKNKNNKNLILHLKQRLHSEHIIVTLNILLLFQYVFHKDFKTLWHVDIILRSSLKCKKMLFAHI